MLKVLLTFDQVFTFSGIQRLSSFNVVAMFTQTMGMTASDWPVFHVVKKSQTIDLFYLLQELL